MAKTKLELTWIGKENRPKLEPRILLEDPTFSYHAPHRVSENDIFDNRLIFGDNLLALKALEQEFTGKIKCIYIDPPYNTGNAFEHYDDGVEHSLWLGLMRDRLQVLRRLLSPDGFFCCHIDDSESHYLKVLLDEVFGRPNYLMSFYFQVRYGHKTLAEDNDYQKVIEQCFVYAKDQSIARANKDKEPYKVEKFCWEIIEGRPSEEFEVKGRRVQVFKNGDYEIKRVEPHIRALKETWATGSLVRQKGSSGEFLDTNLIPRRNIDGLSCLYKVYGIGEDGIGYRYMTGPKKQDATKGKFYSGIPLQTIDSIARGDSDKAMPIQNFHDLAGNFGNCRHEGGVDFGGGKKPEVLLSMLVRYFSNPGDWVLDSFAGSGTTGAVAHKMGRRWIMVELGEHCHTHIVPRLKKVVAGEDKSGITEATNWNGGGGFRYFRLAPSLLEKDAFGNWIINKQYNPAMLAEAICKLEGFKYSPSETLYWQHGQASENDYIYVTTQTLSREQLAHLSEEVGENRSLLVMCSAFRTRNLEAFPNLNIKKIPRTVLSRCEWGKDDYSLEIKNLPALAPKQADDLPPPDNTRAARKAKAKAQDHSPTLFD